MRLNREELDQSLARQRAEILSDDNRWFAGEFYGHPPTDAECATYYCEHGGAAGFRQRMERRYGTTSSVSEP